VWYHVKVLYIRLNLFAGTEMLCLSIYEPIAIQIVHGGTVPQFWRKGGDSGRVWYPVKAHHYAQNLSIDTETLSLSVYEPIASQIVAWGTVPEFGGEG
jgi:hypothetical protein